MGRLNDFFSQPFDTEIYGDMKDYEIRKEYVAYRAFSRLAPLLGGVAFACGAVFLRENFSLLQYLFCVLIGYICCLFLFHAVLYLIRTVFPRAIMVLLVVFLPLLVMIMKR